MDTQLLEIHPRELKFLFELKKQSSCAVHLTNLTDQYVAFKVKTTSPKKYCVRPNVGIINPKAVCDFTVTMQAQKSTMPECKDKFLIQSTVVPYGTNEEDITSSMFSKESRKYVEETKLRVVLASEPNSPSMPPAETVVNEESVYENLIPKEHSPVFSPVNGVNKQEPSYETVKPKDKLQNGAENFPRDMLLTKVEEPINDENKEEPKSVNDIDCKKLVPADSEELHRVHGVRRLSDAAETKSELTIDAEELRSTITTLTSKLLEAENMILRVKEEKINTLNQNKALQQELETVTGSIKQEATNEKRVARTVQVGFPPLFVCMVALICFFMGAYLF